MQLPGPSSANLYQYATVLSAAIVCFSLIGVKNSVVQSQEEYESYLEHHFSTTDESQQQYWKSLLEKQSKNSHFVAYSLSIVSLVGSVVFLLCIRFWYINTQQYIDMKLRVETEQIEDKKFKQRVGIELQLITKILIRRIYEHFYERLGFKRVSQETKKAANHLR